MLATMTVNCMLGGGGGGGKRSEKPDTPITSNRSQSQEKITDALIDAVGKIQVFFFLRKIIMI